MVNMNLDNMSQEHTAVRKVDEAVQIDVVVDYDRTGRVPKSWRKAPPRPEKRA